MKPITTREFIDFLERYTSDVKLETNMQDISFDRGDELTVIFRFTIKKKGGELDDGTVRINVSDTVSLSESVGNG